MVLHFFHQSCGWKPYTCKLTWPLKIGLPKRKLVSQPPFLRGYVRFREGNYFSTYLLDRRQKDNNLATVEYTKLAKYSGVPVWDPQILRDCVFSIGTPQSLAWNLEMMVSNRNLLFQGLIFRCHVKLQ